MPYVKKFDSIFYNYIWKKDEMFDNMRWNILCEGTCDLMI